MKIKIESKTKFILARTASLFFVLFLAVANSNVVLADDLYYNNPQITPAKMLDLTNQSRKESGLFALTVDQKLVSAAEAKAGDMFKYQYFEHNSPSGVTPWDWIKEARYDYRYAGENLAIDFVTAEHAHKALMASDSHRENILNQKYTEIGISVKKDIFEENESIIIVMEFGAPLEAKVAYASSDNTDEGVELSNNTELSNINSDINSVEKEPQRKVADLPPAMISSDPKEDNDQNIGGNIKEQEGREVIYLNDKNNKKDESDREDIKDSKKIAYNAGMIKLIGISTDNIRKNDLEKVYSENIYWKSYGRKNINGQTTVMSSGRQNKGGFNSNIFYTCVLSIFFMFESLYLFSNFMIGGKFKTVQSGELDISLGS